MLRNCYRSRARGQALTQNQQTTTQRERQLVPSAPPKPPIPLRTTTTHDPGTTNPSTDRPRQAKCSPQGCSCVTATAQELTITPITPTKWNQRHQSGTTHDFALVPK